MRRIEPLSLPRMVHLCAESYASHGAPLRRELCLPWCEERHTASHGAKRDTQPPMVGREKGVPWWEESRVYHGGEEEGGWYIPTIPPMWVGCTNSLFSQGIPYRPGYTSCTDSVSLAHACRAERCVTAREAQEGEYPWVRAPVLPPGVKGVTVGGRFSAVLLRSSW